MRLKGGLAKRLVALWAQKRPYLNKFEAPEALDRCIRILMSRRIFLAILENPLTYCVCTTKTADVLGLQNYKKYWLWEQGTKVPGGGGDGRGGPTLKQGWLGNNKKTLSIDKAMNEQHLL